jgi:2',3'-cyclic-nucleotide 2'-phosphodiesterase (5'-nucleotidase family)
MRHEIKTRRTLTIILAMLMVFTMIPATALATNVDPVSITQPFDVFTASEAERAVDPVAAVEAATPSIPQLQEGHQRIDILTFTDLHGHVEQGAPVVDNPGAARLAAFIAHQRNLSPNSENVIVVGGGDEFHGYAVSTILNGEPVLSLMDFVAEEIVHGDADFRMALGNHEFSYSYDRAVEFGGRVTLLAADVFYAPGHPRAGQRPDWVQPYEIVEFGEGEKKITIALVGLMQTGMPSLTGNFAGNLVQRTPTATSPAEWLEALQELIADIHEDYNPNAMIAVTHLSGNNAALAHILRNVDDFDAVVSGHSHTRRNITVEGTPVIEAHFHGRALGRISLTFDEEGELLEQGGVGTWLSPANAIRDFDRAAAVVAEVESYYDAVSDLMRKYIDATRDELHSPIAPHGIYFNNRDSRDVWVTQLLHDYVVRATGIRNIVGVTNSGGWRNTGYWPRNADDPITLASLLSTMPFDNTVLLIPMRGRDLNDMLNRSNLIHTGIHGTNNNWVFTDTGDPLTISDDTYWVTTSNFLWGGHGRAGGSTAARFPGNSHGNAAEYRVVSEYAPYVLIIGEHENFNVRNPEHALRYTNEMNDEPSGWYGLNLSQQRQALVDQAHWRGETSINQWRATLRVNSEGGTAAITAPFAPAPRLQNFHILNTRATVTATAPIGGAPFLGWFNYGDNPGTATPLSTNLVYNFTIREDTSLVAHFDVPEISIIPPVGPPPTAGVESTVTFTIQTPSSIAAGTPIQVVFTPQSSVPVLVGTPTVHESGSTEINVLVAADVLARTYLMEVTVGTLTATHNFVVSGAYMTVTDLHEVANNTTVTVRGVVTGYYLPGTAGSGLYLQDPDSVATVPGTEGRRGILVRTPVSNSGVLGAFVGQIVEVQGELRHSDSGNGFIAVRTVAVTNIGNQITALGAGVMPETVPVTLQQLDDGSFMSMLVRVTEPVTITNTLTGPGGGENRVVTPNLRGGPPAIWPDPVGTGGIQVGTQVNINRAVVHWWNGRNEVQFRTTDETLAADITAVPNCTCDPDADCCDQDCVNCQCDMGQPVGGLTVTLHSVADWHGMINSEMSATDPGAARFVTFMDARSDLILDETGYRPVVLGAGDSFFGQSINNLMWGEPALRILNRIGTRFNAVGNHEFSWQNRALTETFTMTDPVERAAAIANISRATNPVWELLPQGHDLNVVEAGIAHLAADIIYDPGHPQAGQHPNWLRPYAILEGPEVGCTIWYDEYGVRIAIIGLSHPTIEGMTGPMDRQHLAFRTPRVIGAAGTIGSGAAALSNGGEEIHFEWLEEMINDLRDPDGDYGVSAVVILSHTSSGFWSNDIAYRLLRRGNAHIDGFFSGHTHSTANQRFIVDDVVSVVVLGHHHGRGHGQIQLIFDDEGELIDSVGSIHNQVDGTNATHVRAMTPDPDVFAWVHGVGATWTQTGTNQNTNLTISNQPVYRDEDGNIVTDRTNWGWEQLRNYWWGMSFGPRITYATGSQHHRNQFLVNLLYDYVNRVQAEDMATAGVDGVVIINNQSAWRGQTGAEMTWSPEDTVSIAQLMAALTFENTMPLFEIRGQDLIEMLNMPGSSGGSGIATNQTTPGRWTPGGPGMPDRGGGLDWVGYPNWHTLQGSTVAGAFYQDGVWHLAATLQPISADGTYLLGASNHLFGSYGANGGQHWPLPGNNHGNALGFVVNNFVDDNDLRNNGVYARGPRFAIRDEHSDLHITIQETWLRETAWRNEQVLDGVDLASLIEVETTYGGTAALHVWGFGTRTFPGSSTHSGWGNPAMPGGGTVRDLVLNGHIVRATATITNEEYDFIGWFDADNPDPNAPPLSVEPVFIFNATEDITLVARFAIEEVDFDALQALVDAVANYIEADFAADSWSDFETALYAAENILTEGAATQSEVDDALNALQEARANLVDLRPLRTELARANALNSADWANWAAQQAAIREAISNAEQVYGNPAATATQVNEARVRLSNAIATLIRVQQPGPEEDPPPPPPPPQQQPEQPTPDTDPDEDEYDDPQVPLDPPPIFVDIPGHWAREAIEFVKAREIMVGVSDTAFAPDAVLTRAMMATILWRLEGEPATAFTPVFGDVPAGRWYSEAIVWANEQDIVRGVGGGLFDPHSNITREQFAAMMHRYAAFIEIDSEVPATHSLAQFTDAGQIGSWALEYVLWANYNELLTGVTATTLNPLGMVTRAQSATVLQRFMVRFVD